MTPGALVAAADPATTAYDEYRNALLAEGLLYETGVAGVYGYSARYQSIVAAVGRLITSLGGDLFETVTFPPVLSRSTFDRTDYLRSFPNLMGSVHVFRGGNHEHRLLADRFEKDENWSELLDPSEVVLSSAACHPIYALASGRLPEGGRRIEIQNWCFRHEPGPDPARMVAFRMHELVFMGEPQEAQDYRDTMLATGVELLAGLGLPMDIIPANDPFFGRLGTLLATTQLEENLKLEGVTPISGTRPTAIVSGNCAREHFGGPFAISTADGEVAHTACVAFGVDRITLALLRRHGLDPSSWPGNVWRRLWQ